MDTLNLAVDPTSSAKVVAEFRDRKLAAGKSPRTVKITGELLLKFGAGGERQNIHEFARFVLPEPDAVKASSFGFDDVSYPLPSRRFDGARILVYMAVSELYAFA